MRETIKADVVIVGAGPCGVTLANYLGVYGINAHRAVGETAGLCTMKDFFQPQKKQAEACLCKTPEGFMQPVKRSLVHDRRGHGHGDHVCHPCALRQSLHGACLGGVLSAHQKLFAGWG